MMVEIPIKRVTTALYRVGRYTFVAVMPTVGLATDRPRWRVKIDSAPIPGEFDELEEAMEHAATTGRLRAAIAAMPPRALQQEAPPCS
jgi:hypothetical protein